MREFFGRRGRALAAGTVAGAACLLVGLTPGSASSAARSVPGLPVEAKGLLGTLDTGSGAHKLVFDTSAGRYALDGVKSEVGDRRAIRMADGWRTPVFDFEALRLGQGTVVSVRGKNPLVIVSKGDVSIATPLRLDGKPGADNGRGAGGGGGGGGGAVAILSKGTLTVSGAISVNGGPGGVGNAAWQPIYGGDGGAGSVTLASAKKVELVGAISALTGGKTGSVAGPVTVVGPVAYGATATINGVEAAKAPALQAMPGMAKGTFAIAGGSGGGGGGGTGLPDKDPTSDYVKTKSPGGVGGPGGLAGGAGSYAVAGGQGGEGGLGLTAGGGGGGGGGYSGPGGAGAFGPVANGAAGAAGGGGICPAAPPVGGAGGNGGTGGGGVPGGTGGAGAVGAAGGNAPVGGFGQGGGGGGGGSAVGFAGGNGGNGNFGGGGGGGGGGGDGCLPTPPGAGGNGGNGGPAARPGRNGSPGRWADPFPVIGGVDSKDASGVDFDAACLVGEPTRLTPSGPNNVPSPGSYTDCLFGTYDGSTESTDLNRVTLASTGVDNPGPSDDQLVATWRLDAPLPPAGGQCNPAVGGPGCPDLPNNSFVGTGFKTLFQVPARQNNTPTNAVGGGCPRIPVGQVFDQHEHWLDGFHFFIGFDVVWDGARWIHSAQVGEYDPSPDGAFFFTELGVDNGSGWTGADPAAQFGTNWYVTYGPGFQVSVTVDGVLGSADAVNCANGVFNTVYFKNGDTIANVKALSTADSTVTLPVTVPLSLVPGFSDITSVGGFIFYSDITEGNSTNSGVVGGALQANRSDVSYTGGFLGISDTLGDSPACPTPTFGGTLPPNPFLNPAVGCQYDDDNVPVPNAGSPAGPWTATNPGERGTFLTEGWDTAFSFVA
jgi:hypothetical protein